MKRLLVSGLFCAAALIACQPTTPAPTPLTCTDVPLQPATQVTLSNVQADTDAKVLSSNDVLGIEGQRLSVLDASNSVQAGQVLVSNCAEGVLRKVTGVQVQSQGLQPQGLRKVYVQTAEASLEDLLQAGDIGIDYGTLDLGPNATVQALPGIAAQAVNGKIGFTNVKVPLPGGQSVTLNGSVTQTLEPKFNLKLVNNTVDKFEIGLAGSLSAELSGTFEAAGKLALQTGVEQIVAQYSMTRAFPVGAVPVVIVLEPKLIVGAAAGANDKVKVTTGIKPTLTINLGLSYDRNRASKWQVASNPVNLALNPSFSVTTPAQGDGKVYSKLVVGVKLYGVAGPELEFKPYIDTDINPNSTAAFHTGISSSANLVAGFNVLGKGLALSTPLVQPPAAAKNYLCSTSGCTLQ